MILNFGKFKGQSIESLKRSPDGVSYLEWGAAESGQPVPKLRAISNRFFMDWWEQPASRFSSPAAYEMFRCYMKELWG